MAVSETKARGGWRSTLVYYVLSFLSFVAVVVIVGYLRSPIIYIARTSCKLEIAI